ncbi:MAG: hypothetical protein P1U64_04040 [Alcanivoracaceae bacterium]|nr:hypothetical protein [Alcanivoracaceae bacterium]
MARYRKVDPRIWNDAKFRDLSDNAKLVFFMLLTHPNMTALGAMRATLAGLGEEMGWEPEAFREAFQEVLSKGMAEHDQSACLIALPRFIKYNQPESPNVVKAWASALDLLPECDLKSRVIAGARDYAKAKGKAYTEALPEALAEALAEALPEALAKGIPNQEQEQEQEQEQDSSSPSAQNADKPRQSKRRTSLPVDFEPTETEKQLAEEHGVSLAQELPQFKDHHAAKGTTMKDWHAGLRTWIRNAAKFAKQRQSTGVQQLSSADRSRLAIASSKLSVADRIRLANPPDKTEDANRNGMP